MLGRRQSRHPPLEVFAAVAGPTETKRAGTPFVLALRHQTKAYDEVLPPCGLIQFGGPRAIRPIVTGPAWPPCVTGLICKGIPVITVCNPALWEYSGDNLGS
jgi:hypothetical protein